MVVKSRFQVLLVPNYRAFRILVKYVNLNQTRQAKEIILPQMTSIYSYGMI